MLTGDKTRQLQVDKAIFSNQQHISINFHPVCEVKSLNVHIGS